MNKYRAKAVVIDGHRLDSQAEGRRYSELRLLERAGEISHLRVHPVMLLEDHGRKLGSYVPDFAYVDKRKNVPVFEDVKSPATLTPLSKLKIALFEAQYRTTVQIIMSKRRRAA